MRAFGIFGLLFGGSPEDKSTDREAIKAEVEAEVDFIFDTAQERIAERREELRQTTTLKPPQLVAESPEAILVKSAVIDPAKLKGAKLRVLATNLGVEFHPRHNDESIRRLIAELA